MKPVIIQHFVPSFKHNPVASNTMDQIKAKVVAFIKEHPHYAFQDNIYHQHLLAHGGAVTDMPINDIDLVFTSFPEELFQPFAKFMNLEINGATKGHQGHINKIKPCQYIFTLHSDKPHERLSVDFCLTSQYHEDFFENDTDTTRSQVAYRVFDDTPVSYGISAEQDVKNKIVHLVNKNLLEIDPKIILRLMELVTKKGWTFDAEIKEVIGNLTSEHFRLRAASVWATFEKLLEKDYASSNFMMLKNYQLFHKIFPALSRLTSDEQDNALSLMQQIMLGRVMKLKKAPLKHHVCFLWLVSHWNDISTHTSTTTQLLLKWAEEELAFIPEEIWQPEFLSSAEGIFELMTSEKLKIEKAKEQQRKERAIQDVFDESRRAMENTFYAEALKLFITLHPVIQQERKIQEHYVQCVIGPLNLNALSVEVLSEIQGLLEQYTDLKLSTRFKEAIQKKINEIKKIIKEYKKQSKKHEKENKIQDFIEQAKQALSQEEALTILENAYETIPENSIKEYLAFTLDALITKEYGLRLSYTTVEKTNKIQEYIKTASTFNLSLPSFSEESLRKIKKEIEKIKASLLTQEEKQKKISEYHQLYNQQKYEELLDTLEKRELNPEEHELRFLAIQALPEERLTDSLIKKGRKSADVVAKTTTMGAVVFEDFTRKEKTFNDNQEKIEALGKQISEENVGILSALFDELKDKNKAQGLLLCKKRMQWILKSPVAQAAKYLNYFKGDKAYLEQYAENEPEELVDQVDQNILTQKGDYILQLQECFNRESDENILQKLNEDAASKAYDDTHSAACRLILCTKKVWAEQQHPSLLVLLNQDYARLRGQKKQTAATMEAIMAYTLWTLECFIPLFETDTRCLTAESNLGFNTYHEIHEWFKAQQSSLSEHTKQDVTRLAALLNKRILNSQLFLFHNGVMEADEERLKILENVRQTEPPSYQIWCLLENAHEANQRGETTQAIEYGFAALHECLPQKQLDPSSLNIPYYLTSVDAKKMALPNAVEILLAATYSSQVIMIVWKGNDYFLLAENGKDNKKPDFVPLPETVIKAMIKYGFTFPRLSNQQAASFIINVTQSYPEINQYLIDMNLISNDLKPYTAVVDQIMILLNSNPGFDINQFFDTHPSAKADLIQWITLHADQKEPWKIQHLASDYVRLYRYVLQAASSETADAILASKRPIFEKKLQQFESEKRAYQYKKETIRDHNIEAYMKLTLLIAEHAVDSYPDYDESYLFLGLRELKNTLFSTEERTRIVLLILDVISQLQDIWENTLSVQHKTLKQKRVAKYYQILLSLDISEEIRADIDQKLKQCSQPLSEAEQWLKEMEQAYTTYNAKNEREQVAFLAEHSRKACTFIEKEKNTLLYLDLLHAFSMLTLNYLSLSRDEAKRRKMLLELNKHLEEAIKIYDHSEEERAIQEKLIAVELIQLRVFHVLTDMENNSEVHMTNQLRISHRNLRKKLEKMLEKWDLSAVCAARAYFELAILKQLTIPIEIMTEKDECYALYDRAQSYAYYAYYEDEIFHEYGMLAAAAKFFIEGQYTEAYQLYDETIPKLQRNARFDSLFIARECCKLSILHQIQGKNVLASFNILGMLGFLKKNVCSQFCVMAPQFVKETYDNQQNIRGLLAPQRFLGGSVSVTDNDEDSNVAMEKHQSSI